MCLKGRQLQILVFKYIFLDTDDTDDMPQMPALIQSRLGKSDFVGGEPILLQD